MGQIVNTGCSPYFRWFSAGDRATAVAYCLGGGGGVEYIATAGNGDGDRGLLAILSETECRDDERDMAHDLSLQQGCKVFNLQA